MHRAGDHRTMVVPTITALDPDTWEENAGSSSHACYMCLASQGAAVVNWAVCIGGDGKGGTGMTLVALVQGCGMQISHGCSTLAVMSP